jgi:short-subunit dehydrogenase
MSDSPLQPLDRQVIVITGASSGIGLCTARLAAARGAHVVLVARSGDVLQKTARDIEKAGGRAIAVVADVASREQLEAAAQAAVQAFGRIDTWINNAGVSIYGRLDAVTEDDSRRLFATNFWGVVNGSLAALPHLKKQGGALINVGSEASESLLPLQGMYASSKHAVKGFTDALRLEVEEFDQSPVRITLIQPSSVNTPYPAHARNYLDVTPTLPDPMTDPIDVAEAILHAATQGGRDVKVGARSMLGATLAQLMPALGDKIAARQVHEWAGNDPVHTADGTLYVAGDSGRTHGRATP